MHLIYVLLQFIFVLCVHNQCAKPMYLSLSLSFYLFLCFMCFFFGAGWVVGDGNGSVVRYASVGGNVRVGLNAGAVFGFDAGVQVKYDARAAVEFVDGGGSEFGVGEVTGFVYGGDGGYNHM